jgi:hypothetical protein
MSSAPVDGVMSSAPVNGVMSSAPVDVMSSAVVVDNDGAFVKGNACDDGDDGATVKDGLVDGAPVDATVRDEAADTQADTPVDQRVEAAVDAPVRVVTVDAPAVADVPVTDEPAAYEPRVWSVGELRRALQTTMIAASISPERLLAVWLRESEHRHPRRMSPPSSPTGSPKRATNMMPKLLGKHDYLVRMKVRKWEGCTVSHVPQHSVSMRSVSMRSPSAQPLSLSGQHSLSMRSLSQRTAQRTASQRSTLSDHRLSARSLSQTRTVGTKQRV